MSLAPRFQLDHMIHFDLVLFWKNDGILFKEGAGDTLGLIFQHIETIDKNQERDKIYRERQHEHNMISQG